MKVLSVRSRLVLLGLALSLLFSACSSTTMIQSSPAGARVYLNGEPVGTTPYRHTDTKIVGTTTTLKLVKEGYEPLHSSFCRDEEVDAGAIVGGVFFWLPFLWTMKYKAIHNYELVPVSVDIRSIPPPEGITNKSARLKELKQLLAENLITLEEYEAARKKIIDDL